MQIRPLTSPGPHDPLKELSNSCRDLLHNDTSTHMNPYDGGRDPSWTVLCIGSCVATYHLI